MPGSNLHSEHPVAALAGRVSFCVGSRPQGETDNVPCVRGVYDAIVPQPSSREVGPPLCVVAVHDDLPEGRLLRLSPLPPRAQDGSTGSAPLKLYHFCHVAANQLFSVIRMSIHALKL